METIRNHFYNPIKVYIVSDTYSVFYFLFQDSILYHIYIKFSVRCRCST